MTTRTSVGRVRLLGTLVLVTGALGAYVLFGTPDNVGTQTDRGERGKVIRAEVEASTEMHVMLVSTSTEHGRREHVNATYSRYFGYDIHVEPGETVFVTLTSAVDVNRDRRIKHECVLRENGKAVRRSPVTIRAGEPVRPATCEWQTTG